MDLSVVIPVYNEEANIKAFYERSRKSTDSLGISSEYVFVNDGSTDRSLELIKALAREDIHVKYIDLSRNFGHQVAITAGLERSIGNAVVFIDGDLQDPPEFIPTLYRKLKEGYHVVYAKRKSRKGESILKKITARFFYRILSRITSVDIPIDTGDFRIIDRKVADILKQMSEQEKFLRGQIAWMGFKQISLEYDREERYAGQTGYTYRKMIRFALDGITSFSNFPLKFATIAGFGVSGMSFILILYALYSRFITKDYVPGWASLMLSVLFIGGIQLIGIGIIGEYISRISANVRKRPLYIINESNIEEPE